MEHKHILYDIEDDAIDRGDATNLSEALSYFNIDTSTDDKKDTDNQLHGDALYHNMYYKDKKRDMASGYLSYHVRADLRS